MEIPKGWELVKLGDVCTFPQYGYTTSGAERGNLKPLRTTDITSGKINWDNVPFCKENPQDIQKYLLNDGDIVISRAGSVGVSYLIHKPQKSVFASYLIRFKPFDNIVVEKFFYYFLKSPLYWNEISEKSLGIAVPNVNASKLKSIPIPLSPLPEQHRIVDKIEALFSRLDKGIENLKTAQQQLKVYRQAVLKWAFENTSQDEKIKLIDACEFITKGTTPLKNELFFQKGEIPFLKVYNLTFDGGLDFSIDPTFVSVTTHNGFLKRSKVFPGDVLMNIVGPPLGKVSIVPDTFPEWNINQAIARFRCKNSLINKYLAYFLLSGDTIRKYAKKAKATVGQFNLTLEICRNIVIPIPSIPEQQAIVSAIESRLSVCDKVEEIITYSLKQAEGLRQSILKKAFEGKLVSQDPNDEPASVLLERIKAKNETNKPAKNVKTKKVK